MDSDAESDNEAGAIPDASAFKKSKSKSTTPGDDDDDESDDSYWDSDSDESSSSSGDDQPGMSLREKFLKKSGGSKEEKGQSREEKKEKKDKLSAKKIRDRHRIEEGSEDEEDEEGWTKVSTGAVDKPKMFEKDAEINHELVIRKLKEIMAARGKKRTNRKEQIELLSELLEIAEEHK